MRSSADSRGFLGLNAVYENRCTLLTETLAEYDILMFVLFSRFLNDDERKLYVQLIHAKKVYYG